MNYKNIEEKILSNSPEESLTNMNYIKPSPLPLSLGEGISVICSRLAPHPSTLLVEGISFAQYEVTYSLLKRGLQKMITL